LQSVGSREREGREKEIKREEKDKREVTETERDGQRKGEKREETVAHDDVITGTHPLLGDRITQTLDGTNRLFTKPFHADSSSNM
jgi:hypothetical protein